ncbi:hypothetical protein MASR2M15_00330 [Anaerolineales bacterium]
MSHSQRPLLTFVLILALFSISLGSGQPLQAQESPEDMTNLAQLEAVATDIKATLNDLDERLTESNKVLDRSDQNVEDVGRAVDYAFNLLGLFEAIGFFVTVGAGMAGLFGILRLFSAQNELTKAREQFDQDVTELRLRLEKQVEDKERELDSFRLQIERTVTHEMSAQRETTGRALLAQSLLPLGERQYKAGDPRGALNTYHRALDLDPKNPIIHYRLGYVYVQEDDLEKARQYFESSIQIEDNFSPALAGLGFVHRKIGQKMEEGIEQTRAYNKCESLMLKALSETPNLLDEDGESWWGALGGLYRRRNQIDEAIKAYERATLITPHSSYGWGNLALLYMQSNQQDKMLQTYKRVERLAVAEAVAEVNNYWGYSDVVVSRLALGNAEGANDFLDTTLELASAEYMLEMLHDTLTRLNEVVEEEKRPAIQTVLARIEKTIQSRFKDAEAATP